MSDEKIGGISLDDIMAAAMEGLDDNSDRKDGPDVIEIDFGTKKESEIKTDFGTKKDSQPTGVYSIAGYEFPNAKARFSASDERFAEEIINYIDAGRTAEAAQMAQQLVDRNISNEVAWLINSHAQKEYGDNNMAIKSLEQAVAINPSFACAYNEIGVIYLDIEDYDAALTCFEKAVEIDPKSNLYMANIATTTACTENFGAAIEKCEHFIEMSDDKIYLQNVLGQLYVHMSRSYVVDVPDDFENPEGETTPGFVSLEDINDVRKYCNKAKSLLTLDSFKEEYDDAELLLQICDLDCELAPTHRQSAVISNAVIICIIYTIITLIWGLPLGIAAAIFTFKADKFPRYMHNYAWCTGSFDPLKYTKDSFYKNHELLKTFSDGYNEAASEYQKAVGNISGTSSWGDVFSVIGKTQVWFFKARIQYYKRFIQQKKEEKNSVGTVALGDNKFGK